MSARRTLLSHSKGVCPKGLPLRLRTVYSSRTPPLSKTHTFSAIKLYPLVHPGRGPRALLLKKRQKISHMSSLSEQAINRGTQRSLPQAGGVAPPVAPVPAVGSLAQRMQHWRPIVKSEWILKTIEKGYRIQFMHSPPSFSRIIHSQAVGEAAHFLAAEIESLLEKRAIQVVPPAQAMSGFYSRYFIIKKKGGGMRPTYIGSEGIEYASQTIQISDVDTFSTAEVRTSRRLVHHPGPGRRILPYPNLPPAQKVSQICLSRGDLRVFGSSFRPVTKPASLCEMHRSRVRSTQYERDSSGNLYRRLPPGCEFSTGGNCSYGTHDPSQ